MHVYEIALYTERTKLPLGLSYLIVEGRVLDVYTQTAKGLKRVTKQEKLNKLKVDNRIDIEVLIRKLSDEETKSLLQKIKP